MSFGVVHEERWIAVILTVLSGLAIAAVAGVAYLTSRSLSWASGGALSVSVGSVSLGILTYSAATIAHLATRNQSRLSFAAVNAAILCGSVALCGYVLLRSWVTPQVILWIVAFIAVSHAGIYAFAAHRARNVQRLFRGRYVDVDAIEGRFRLHSLTYVALPLGLFAGTVVGLLRHQPAQLVLQSALTYTLGLVAASTVVFMLRGAVKLTQPYLAADAGIGEATVHQRRAELKVLVPAAAGDDQSSNATIDGIVIATDIRSLLLLNQFQLLAVLLAVSFGLCHLLDVAPVRPVALILFVSAIFLAQAPYIVGQIRARAVLLEQLTGRAREAAREQLNKYAPLFRRVEFLAAVTASGTLGGTAGKVLDKLLEETLR
jgi:hypothetical protein